MLSSPAIALSGMNAALSSLQASAHNVANWSTDGFRRQRAVQTSDPFGGVSVALVQSTEAGSSPEADLIGMLQAKDSFMANLAVFRAGNRTMGSLLDVVS